jgi:fermentation-respiration switch protein FrsA (DUF1100 family)
MLPEGEIYGIYIEKIKKWTLETRQIPHEDLEITSFDGLKLYGKFYEYEKTAPIEIMFHGYRGNAERDLCGGIQRAFALHHNVLLVDQRTSGESEGNVISFGVNESKDCLKWIDFVINEFGEDQKIILTGISMGAATVVITSGYDLPKNIVGVLADCGYSNQKDIIKVCIKKMKLPPTIFYPFVKLGAKVFGHFNLEEVTPIEAIKKSKIPTIFFHGEADDFVPHYMSLEMYNAKKENNKLITIKGADHGLGFLVDDYALNQSYSYVTLPSLSLYL